MIHFKTIQTFLAVAQTKSFSRAARYLHVTQPAISLQIRKLERFYKTKLIDRKGRWIELTDAGKVVQDWAENFLVGLKESQRLVNNLINAGGKYLSIGAGSTSGPCVLATLLGAYQRTYPEAKVVMKIGKFDELLTMLAEGEIELCLSRLPRPIVPYGFRAEPYRRILMRAVAAPGNPLCRMKNISINQFAEEQFILQPKDRLNRQVIDSFFAQRGLQITVRMEFDTVEAIKAAVIENFGVSIIHEESLSSELAARKLKLLPVTDLEISFPLSIVYRNRKRLSETATEFLDFLKRTTSNGDIAKAESL